LFNDTVHSVGAALVEYHRRGKTEVLGEKPVLVLLCPPKNPHDTEWDRTYISPQE